MGGHLRLITLGLITILVLVTHIESAFGDQLRQKIGEEYRIEVEYCSNYLCGYFDEIEKILELRDDGTMLVAYRRIPGDSSTFVNIHAPGTVILFDRRAELIVEFDAEGTPVALLNAAEVRRSLRSEIVRVIESSLSDRGSGFVEKVKKTQLRSFDSIDIELFVLAHVSTWGSFKYQKLTNGRQRVSLRTPHGLLVKAKQKTRLAEREAEGDDRAVVLHRALDIRRSVDPRELEEAWSVYLKAYLDRVALFGTQDAGSIEAALVEFLAETLKGTKPVELEEEIHVDLYGQDEMAVNSKYNIAVLIPDLSGAGDQTRSSSTISTKVYRSRNWE